MFQKLKAQDGAELMKAAEEKNSEQVEAIIQRNVSSIFHVDSKVSYSSKEILRFLNFSIFIQTRETALHCAAKVGHEAAIKMIIGAGAKINANDKVTMNILSLFLFNL